MANRALEFPILYYQGNVLVNRAGQWKAVYRIRDYTYAFLSTADKVSWFQRWRSVLSAIDQECEIHVVPAVARVGNALAAQSAALAKVGSPLAGIGQGYLIDTAQSVDGAHAIEYTTYLVVTLPKPARSGFGDWFGVKQAQRLWRQFRRTLEQARREVPVLIASQLEGYLHEEDVMFQRLRKLLKVDQAGQQDDPDEITRLLQRRYHAGIKEDVGRGTWAPDAFVSTDGDELRMEPTRAEVASLGTGEVDLRNPRRVAVTQVVDGREATSYQSFMALSALPDRMTLPGGEWAFRLQDLPFPVEVCVRWSPRHYREAITMLRRKRLETQAQTEEANRVGEHPPIDVAEAHEQIEEYEQQLKANREPALEMTVLLGVYAGDEKTLWERVTQVRDAMGDEQLHMVTPSGDQWKMFLEFLPGAPRQFKPTGQLLPDPAFIHRVPPDVVAAAMFGATHRLGDQFGAYIGRTGVLGRPVVVRVGLGPRINKSASVAIIGTLGGGKTFLLRLLFWIAVLTEGARGLLIDQKGESEEMVQRLCEVFPELAEHVNLITLSAREEDTGMLDLLAMARTGARREAGNMAISILKFLLNTRGDQDRELLIAEAVEAALEADVPCMERVVEYLTGHASPLAQQMGRILTHLKRRAYANLLFGNGQERAISTKAAATVLQLQHLTLPDREKHRDDYTDDELLSVAVMSAVVGFGHHFMNQDRHVFKVFSLDEAWKTLGTQIGKNMVKHVLRTCRAMNGAVHIATQSHLDLVDEGIRNNFGMRFAFRSTDEAEVRGQLQFLGLEHDPETVEGRENIYTIRSLDNGEALMQDLHGRIGLLEVDAVHDWLAHAFDTRPPESNEMAPAEYEVAAARWEARE